MTKWRGCLWCCKNVLALKNVILVVLAIVVPSPLLLDSSSESRCAYAMMMMAILWLTEALPIPVTALLPIFMLPLLGVTPAKRVSGKYVNDTTMLFLGGLIVAVAVEEVNLHRRIAMNIIMLLGSQPNMLMLGLMLPTWFLSMWISNTAATSMMVPIILAVSEQLKDMESKDNVKLEPVNGSNGSCDVIKSKDRSSTPGDVALDMTESNEGNTGNMSDKQFKLICKGFALSVAYGANIGGVATLTGTPPNLILQGQANSIYRSKLEGADSGITFANWMGFALPLSIILLILSWIWLQMYFLRTKCFYRISNAKKLRVREALKEEYRKLGKLSFQEIEVMILFVCLAALWIFRDIPRFGGWRFLFLEDPKLGAYTKDSTPSILIAVLLFILPSRVPNVFCRNGYNEDGTDENPVYKPILNWKTAVYKVPWGVIVLLGGGFALADASLTSGLSRWVGCELSFFSFLAPWQMNIILCFVVAGATEITSNSATATLLMPIMAELAINTGIHPLYLMISSAVACSFAFMLPVATPPNAIVFSTGFIRIPDMAAAGLMMNILAVGVAALAINTWGTVLFDLDTMPDIFKSTGVSNSSCGGVLNNAMTSFLNSTTMATNYDSTTL